MRGKKPVYGIGINDANYNVYRMVRTDGKLEMVWVCPFYIKWKDMLKRCYSKTFQIKCPTYKEHSVVPEWHYFMSFKAWMEKQDWEGKQLDKDILSIGNKVYSPDICTFVSSQVNSFITESTTIRGQLPIGVSFSKTTGKYQAQCKDVITNKIKYLGVFTSPREAHQAWLTFKLGQAKILASQQSDPRVAAALIDRYENYEKYFGGLSSQELT